MSFLAMDYGASSGRGILGRFDGGRLALEEVHRFANYFVDVDGTYYWDAFRLFHELQEALARAGAAAGPPPLRSVGIDGWGTDYGLVDERGQLLGNCRCMRNADGRWAEACNQRMSYRRLFERTGAQRLYGNTAFQLHERVATGDPAVAHADKLLMIPELLAYFLTGEKHGEYTMATTSMLYNLGQRAWDGEIADVLGIRRSLLCDLLLPGEGRFPVRAALCEVAGLRALECVYVGTHDTASAVAATPLEEDVAFCSSGTWSIVGVETERPVLTEAAFLGNFSNEGTVDGRFRLLKNIMGMWVLQQCAAEWALQGSPRSWEELVQEAGRAPAFRSFIDLEAPEFYRSGDMLGRIRSWCARTGQAVPQTVGEVARCVYESLAMRYRYTLEQLEQVTGRQVKALHVVGGGCKNRWLNQLTSNAIGREVRAGPVEGAAIGNLLVQAGAFGEVRGLGQLREVVRRSFPIDRLEPQDQAAWADAYGRYRRVAGLG